MSYLCQQYRLHSIITGLVTVKHYHLYYITLPLLCIFSSFPSTIQISVVPYLKQNNTLESPGYTTYNLSLNMYVHHPRILCI